tara:strand:- start:3436 stop:4983 length:1548 start_codon:yes stop_codon:yes gene_type:complete
MAPASPLAGGIQAVRRNVSASTFTGRAAASDVAQPDSITTNLLARNNLALTGVAQQISTVSNQVAFLNRGLSSLNNGLTVSATLEKQKAQEEAKRQQKLAQIKLREGKESALENKIQNALMKPVNRIGSKVQFGLQRLANFFTIILGGWIASGTVELFQALATGNTEKLNEIKSQILGNLAFLGGSIFLIGGGLTLLAANVAKLGFRFLKWGGGKLFGKPIKWLSTMISKQIGGLIPGVVRGAPRGMGSMTAPVADRVTRNTMNKRTGMTNAPPKTGGFLSRLPFIGGAFQVTSDVVQGKDIQDSVTDTGAAMIGSTITTSVIDKLPLGKKWKFLAQAAGGILSWIGSYGLSETLFEDARKAREAENPNADPENYDPNFDLDAFLGKEGASGDIMPSMMTDVGSLVKPSRNDFDAGADGGRDFKNALKEWKMQSAESITPTTNQKTVANNIANSAGVDEQPLFVPTPLQSNNQQPAGSASSASPGRGDGGVPNIPSSNSAFRSYQLLSKKHYQVV